MISKRQIICKVIFEAMSNEAFKIALEELRMEYAQQFLSSTEVGKALIIHNDFKAYEAFVGKLTTMANEYKIMLEREKQDG